MKLYCAPNTISTASVIALFEAEIDAELIRLDFSKGDQTKPEYHAVNPKGRVPALITDQGILTETGAILEFIAATAPQGNLVPTDPWEAAQMRAVMFYLASTMHVNHAHKMRGHRWANDPGAIADMTAKVPQTMTEACHFICDHALAGPFVMGARFTIADPYLYAICSWLEGDGVTVTDFPKILTFRKAMQARKSVQHTHDAGLFG